MSLKFRVIYLFTIVCLLKIIGATEEVNKDYDLMPQLFKYDDYYQCLYHKEDTTFCMVTIKVFPKLPNNASKVWNVIQEVISNENNYRHDLLRHGICLSNNCQNCTQNYTEKVNEIYDQKLKNLGLLNKVEKIRCENKNSSYFIGRIDYIFAILAGLYFAFVLMVSSSLELMKYKSTEKYKVFAKTGFGHVLTCFFISKNWQLLTKIDPKDYKSDFVSSMQGVRFICSIWVIYVHTAVANLSTPLINPEYTEETPYRFDALFQANGGVLVQSLFVISGWLLIVSMLEKVKKSKKITFGYLLFCIFCSLIPILALVVGLHSTWLVHYTRGPFWDDLIGEEYRICRQKWWMNLLFINNFFTSDGWCLIQSWYMAAEFQLFVLGAIIFWFLQSKPRRILTVCGVATVVYIIGAFCYLFWKNMEIVQKFRPELMYNLRLSYTDKYNSTWTSTYMSVPGFVVGLCFGYIFWKYKEKRLFTKKSHIVILWVLCLALVPFSVFFYTFYMLSDYYANSRWFASIYGSLYKTTFSVGIALWLFSMSQGLGGFMKKVLEYPLFHVLVQLSYGAFVVHFTIARLNMALKLYPPFMSDYIMFCDVVMVNTLSYILSLVLTILVQMPFTILSKKMMFILK